MFHMFHVFHIYIIYMCIYTYIYIYIYIIYIYIHKIYGIETGRISYCFIIRSFKKLTLLSTSFENLLILIKGDRRFYLIDFQFSLHEIPMFSFRKCLSFVKACQVLN